METVEVQFCEEPSEVSEVPLANKIINLIVREDYVCAVLFFHGYSYNCGNIVAILPNTHKMYL